MPKKEYVEKKRKRLKGQTAFHCECCGERFSIHSMDVHHATPQAAGGTDVDDNLKSLCQNCHDAIHKIAIKLKSGALSEAEDIARSRFSTGLAKRKRLLEFAHQVYQSMLERKLGVDDDIYVMVFLKRWEYERLRVLTYEYKNDRGTRISIADLATRILQAFIKKKMPEPKEEMGSFSRRGL